MNPPTVARRRLAVALSVAGHPFTLIPCTVALIARPAWLGVAIALAAVATTFAVIAWRVAKGQWSNFDVSDPGQRRGFYAVAIAMLATSTVVGWWFGLPPSAIRGFVVALGLLVTGAALARWTHVSLHMLFGAFCAVLVAGVSLRTAAVFAVVVAATAWSRFALRRHTAGQVLLGVLVGCLAGCMLLALDALAR